MLGTGRGWSGTRSTRRSAGAGSSTMRVVRPLDEDSRMKDHFGAPKESRGGGWPPRVIGIGSLSEDST